MPSLLTAAVLPSMLKRGWGRIINVGSVHSVRAGARGGHNVASKFLFSGLTTEYGTSGVTRNWTYLSAVGSRLVELVAQGRAAPLGIAAAGVLDEYMLYPAWPESPVVNGAGIPVGGGLVVR